MRRVSAYGLAIDSAIPLPGLPLTDAAAAVTIGLAPWHQAPHPDALVIDVRGVARFAVRAGTAIDVHPDPLADCDTIRLFLLGSAMGALLQQRGLLVLHGNAVRIGAACLICVGESGAGKSSVAAALAARGYPPLADDVVAITPQGEALPGLPRVRLWADMARRLGHDPTQLARVRDGFDKFELNLPAHDAAIPVRWIHLLETAPVTHVTTAPIAAAEAALVLRAHSYRPHLLAHTTNEAAQFRRCAALAANSVMARIQRPARGDTIDAVVAALLAAA